LTQENSSLFSIAKDNSLVSFSIKKTGNTSSNLLFHLKGENVISANIVTFIPTNNSLGKVDALFFYNFYYNNERPDGTYNIKTLTDRLQYELNFQNNKVVMEKYSLPKGMQDAVRTEYEPLSATSSCFDYYMVTKLYDGNGNVVSEDWVYIYTICGSQNEGLEPVGESGGPISVDKIDNTSVYNCNYFNLKSTDKLFGIQDPRYMGGGYFTNANHQNEMILDKYLSGYCTWNKSSSSIKTTSWYIQPKLIGTVTFPPGAPETTVEINHEGTYWWQHTTW
jgi:hypothetical protein